MTIWDGVYTTEQAARGEVTANTTCFVCHSDVQWADPTFLSVYEGRRLGDLFENIRRTMPRNAPGSLSAAEYVDVVAYIVSLTGAPAGDSSLPEDLAVLDRILVTHDEGGG